MSRDASYNDQQMDRVHQGDRPYQRASRSRRRDDLTGERGFSRARSPNFSPVPAAPGWQQEARD